MPTYTIYGFRERGAAFAGQSLIQSADLPTACRAAAKFFPPDCVTCAVELMVSRSTVLPTAWYVARRRMVSVAPRAVPDVRDEADEGRDIHCDYSDASALEYGPRG